MFIHRHIFKYLSAALAAVMLIPSCTMIEEDQDGAVGYLTISEHDVELTVDVIMPTKSVPLPSIPDPTDVIYKVTDARGNVYQKGTDSWAEPLVIPVGEYTVEAWSGKNGFGSPYYYGSQTGTIGAEKKTANVTLSVDNSLVAVTVNSDLEGHFTASKVTFTSGGNTHTATLGEYCFVPSRTKLDLVIVIEGTNSIGKPAAFEYKLTPPEPKTAYEVICGKSSTNWPSISLSSDLQDGAFEGSLYFEPAVVSDELKEYVKVNKVKYQIKSKDTDWTTVTPSEVSGYNYISGLTNGTTYSLKASVGNISSGEYTFTPKAFAEYLTVSSSAAHEISDGELIGTSISTSVKADLPSIIAKIASTTAIGTFATSDGQTRSSSASTELNENVSTSLVMENANGWPYIPKGDGYKTIINASCKIGDKTYKADKTVGVNVPSPTFTVTVSGNTTYSYYCNKGAAAANERTAENVFDVTSSISISENILNNINYAKPSVTYSVGDKTESGTYGTSKTHELNSEIGGLSWGSHNLTAVVTFDDCSVTSKEHPCVITGLPYNIDFRNSSSGWTLKDNCTKKDDGLHFDPTATPYANRSFNIPSALNVALYLYSGVQLNATSAISVAHLDVKIGGQNNDKVLEAPTKFAGGRTVTSTETQVNGSMNLSSNSVELKTNSLVAGMWVIVPGLRIDYR